MFAEAVPYKLGGGFTDPLSAIGLILARSGSVQTFLGSCFLFRNPDFALTAAHCVADQDVSQLFVHFPRPQGVTINVMSVLYAPRRGDLAALRVDGRFGQEQFWGHVSNYSLGEEVFAYGFPEDVFGPDARTPTPRLFRGNYQRYMLHRSHLGYEYNAGELSFPAPGGLSGGPVFRPGAQVMVTGMVTENLYSTTVLEAHESVEIDGARTATHYQRVITYGVALLLDSFEDWFQEIGCVQQPTP